jgi:hypothetical protein
VFMCRGNISNAETLLGQLHALRAWETRVGEIGYGVKTELDALEAISIAKHSESTTTAEITDDAWPTLAAGDSVTVTPTDYGDIPVAGTLLRLTHREISVARTDPRAGNVVVHFPRLGYRVELQT